MGDDRAGDQGEGCGPERSSQLDMWTLVCVEGFETLMYFASGGGILVPMVTVGMINLLATFIDSGGVESVCRKSCMICVPGHVMCTGSCDVCTGSCDMCTGSCDMFTGSCDMCIRSCDVYWVM